MNSNLNFFGIYIFLVTVKKFLTSVNLTFHCFSGKGEGR